MCHTDERNAAAIAYALKRCDQLKDGSVCMRSRRDHYGEHQSLSEWIEETNVNFALGVTP